ncbi:unnamed protein product [Brassicogethes aeneus]|uniref:Moesin/ezrin/radixin homolog 1 n=1 Tax=Brassicogethes aeneus TaxID=1431903 RepID=A0A9P0AZF8_BRAAE|nr:unnamed protein product [Brassicogethes aeneus]
MNVIVRTVFKECEFKAERYTKGGQILDLLLKNEGIHEKWYFGIMFLNQEGEEVWIEQSKKTIRELKENARNLNFRVKFYPEDVSEEILETVTLEFFFQQIKSQIIKEEIFCPGTTAVLLASLALQAKFGDYVPKEHRGQIKLPTYLPKRVIREQEMDELEWIENITNMWIKHESIDKEEAMMEYLKIVQNLDMYGVTYFPITNRKGTNVLLGITAYGLNIYEEKNKLTPKINFPWSEIKHLKFKDRKFTITLLDKMAKDFTFMTRSPKSSKIILNLGIGNHLLYVKRRKPDTPEMAKLREKAVLHREKKLLQKQKLLNEKSAKHELQKREKELLRRLEKMQEDMEAKNRDLMEAQRTITLLSEKLEDLQRSKERLEEEKCKLDEMMRLLEESKNMEAMERQKLQDEIRRKHEEVTRIQNEVMEKDEQTRRLQEEVEEARRREEEERRLKEEEARRLEEERRKWEEEEAERIKRGELEELENADNTLPEIEVNEDLQEQLKILQKQLDETKKINEESNEEKIYRDNLAAGRDKFKTLRDIRSGNTKRRADLFENL